MDWLKLFDSGRTIVVAVSRPNGDGAPAVRRMRSEVQYRSSAELWVAVPSNNEMGSRKPFDYDEHVSVELGEDSGVFSFPAVVRRYETRATGDCAVLELSGEPIHRQRRSHVRVPTMTPVKLTLGGRMTRGWSRNVSAGGMLVAMEKHEPRLSAGDEVPFEIEPNDKCPPEDRYPVTGRARVVRSDAGGVYALDFLNLPEAHRQWLVRFVFRRQVELRNIARESGGGAAASR